MVIILVHVEVLPIKRMEFTQTLTSLVQKIKCEQGCLNASFYQCFEDENKFLLVEEWSTPKDAEAHLKADTFIVFEGTICLMPMKPEIMMYTVGKSEPLRL